MDIGGVVTDSPNDPEQPTTAADEKWATYDSRMADLFVERGKCPLDSPEREAAAEAILSLWVAEG
jgi:hypothetical protein